MKQTWTTMALEALLLLLSSVFSFDGMLSAYGWTTTTVRSPVVVPQGSLHEIIHTRTTRGGDAGRGGGRLFPSCCCCAERAGGGGVNGGSDPPPSKHLSASERERRDEEKRRRERADDVIIGKTSAVSGAKDYSLDPRSTQEEWMRQASAIEQKVFRKTEEGLELLKMLKLEEAVSVFDDVFELRPKAYLWQAGIAKFYLDDLEGAADIFARCANTFESKFGGPATEERIWRHACGLKLYNSMGKQDRERIRQSGGIESLLTPIPEKDNTAELLRSENRKVIRITRDLFASTVSNDDISMILARAQLRAIGGALEGTPTLDRKMWKINSWYYLGLYYDVVGNYEESKKCMKMALRLRPSTGNGSDIIHTLPLIHMSRRDLFDDEEIEPDVPDSEDYIANNQTARLTYESRNSKPDRPAVDPIMTESIRSGLLDLRITELRDALRARGLKVIGSKDELIERLFEALINDMGLIP